MGHILDKTRTMMAVYSTPICMWEFALSTAIYLHNRLPHSTHNLSPYETVFGTKPDLSNLVPFYSPGVYNIVRQLRQGVWTHKAIPCRMLGYDENSKDTYIVLRLKSSNYGRLVLSRHDCVFNENIDITSIEVIKQSMQEIESLETNDNSSYMNTAKVPTQPNDTETRSGKQYAMYTLSISDLQGDNNVVRQVVLDNYNSDIDLPVFRKNESDIDDTGYNDDMSFDNDLFETSNSFIYHSIETEDTDTSYPYCTYANSFLSCEYDYYINDLIVCNQLAKLSLPYCPTTIEEAISLSNPDRDKWIISINKELNNFDSRGVFRTADEQSGRGLKSKLIFKIKFDNEYNLIYKTRLVICGYSQVKGLDYQDTYAPTPTISTVFTLLHIAGTERHTTIDFDVSAAFLEGENDFKIYAYLPAYLSKNGISERVHVLNSVYGEKQAPRIWYNYNTDSLVTEGYTRCPGCPNLYYYIDSESKKRIYILIYIDDGLISTTHMELLEKFKLKYNSHMKKVTYCQPIQKYLGIDIRQVEDKFYLSQKLYIEQKLEKDYDEFKIQTIPMSPYIDLPRSIPNDDNDSLLPKTGLLRFLADRTRPDISASTGLVSTGGDKNPSDNHVVTAKRIKDYIITTKTLELELGGKGPIKLFGFTDMSRNKKDRQGGCLYLGLDSGSIHSYSVNSHAKSLSTHEGEIRGMVHLIQEAIYIRNLLEFMEYKQLEPTVIYSDSETGIELCKVLKLTNKSKPFQDQIDYVRRIINDRLIELRFIPSERNVADVLTKALREELFIQHRTTLLKGFGGVLPEFYSSYYTIVELNAMICLDT